ncbi:hypothetical protein [Candidatus Lucifugimonas marina]|uniref:Uncharacterized protein n=1 Tax=Candidatus Lucifugimonas marina TaxID=3038979 RepID=A0AAJ5ZGT7_9CHLR|nr:hypothetical protein [SAR202 cluster bacterium JH702]MDG0868516.1 hypothetical protein [SAR202 cluster bacterium JH639]WFG35149.1 hypothetical protein GKN94_05385 [SAR202 cluster bacterium JH545]WFG39105.1 hypothetical protein GKO48_05550 [SAR202 cluster bacterium JH1073]
MESIPSTESSFRQSYVDRDRIEEDRFEDDRRRRRGMAISLIPLGIAMALIMHYTNIVVAIDDADWQYVLHRPALVNVMKLSLAPILGGGIAMLIAGLIATAIAGREGRYLPLALTVFMYMIFMPLTVGLLLPANLFLLDVTGLSVVDVSVGDAISSWIWGTPFFVLTYTMTGMKQAFWAGAGAVLIGAFVFRYLGPNSETFSLKKTLGATSLAGLIIVFLIMFGPLGIFEILFNQFRAA